MTIYFDIHDLFDYSSFFLMHFGYKTMDDLIRKCAINLVLLDMSLMNGIL